MFCMFCYTNVIKCGCLYKDWTIKKKFNIIGKVHTHSKFTNFVAISTKTFWSILIILINSHRNTGVICRNICCRSEIGAGLQEFISKSTLGLNELMKETKKVLQENPIISRSTKCRHWFHSIYETSEWNSYSHYLHGFHTLLYTGSVPSCTQAPYPPVHGFHTLLYTGSILSCTQDLLPAVADDNKEFQHREWCFC